MGLLPEINRAFVTFDNTLFLWNYTHEKVRCWQGRKPPGSANA